MPIRPDDYDDHRDRMARRSRSKAASGRETGPIPGIADIERRERCWRNLRLFCETYNPSAFRLGWSRDHLRAIDRIEEAAFQGAMYALAMARGSGKTTICRMAALWIVSYAIRRYAFVVGATATKSEECIETLQILMRFGEPYAEDFPEISHPARALAGIANRATGQTCEGESTLIEWSKYRIVLPTVPCPPNWPRTWPRRADGMAPTSGVLVSASGLTGEGIRGSLTTLTTGEMVRPDFVLLDDPQTADSAGSLSQNEARMRLIQGDVLGMAGPDMPLTAVMPCTVIQPGDMVDVILDRTKNPLWRGERSGILTSLPANLAAWDAYFEIYARGVQETPPNQAAANAWYLEHRAELDAGCEASWPDRKKPDDVSAIQHAMHLYYRDKRAFMAEYMNQPLGTVSVSANALDPAVLAARATNIPRGVVPRACTRLTAMIDVGAHLLWWMVCGWDERYGGQILDYGSYPDQRRNYFASSSARILMDGLPEMRGQPQQAVVYGGLSTIALQILGREYRQEETGAAMRVERCLVDANWGPGTDTVYEFCRRSPLAAVLLPSHGKFVGASTAPMESWAVRPGERKGWGWRLTPVSVSGRGRHVVFDVNHWKTFAAERLRTAAGAAGCVQLHEPDDRDHQLLADHCAAEYPVSVTGKGRTVDEWKLIPGRDNHWWDTFVGNCVAVSILGLDWSAEAAARGEAAPSRKRRPVITYEDLQ